MIKIKKIVVFVVIFAALSSTTVSAAISGGLFSRRIILQMKPFVTLYNEDEITSDSNLFITYDFDSQNRNNFEVFFFNSGDSKVKVTLFKKGALDTKIEIDSFEVESMKHLSKEMIFISAGTFFAEIETEQNYEINGYLRVRQIEGHTIS